MADIPQKLKEHIEDFSFITNRRERQEYLIQLADQFDEVKVPETVATQPYDESHRVPACESEAFVWATQNEDGTLTYHFDVLNPQGLSAMAMSVILHDSTKDASPEEIAAIPSDIVFEFFGKDVSMGKGQGLIGIVNMVVAYAKQRLNQST